MIEERKVIKQKEGEGGQGGDSPFGPSYLPKPRSAAFRLLLRPVPHWDPVHRLLMPNTAIVTDEEHVFLILLLLLLWILNFWSGIVFRVEKVKFFVLY